MDIKIRLMEWMEIRHYVKEEWIGSGFIIECE